LLQGNIAPAIRPLTTDIRHVKSCVLLLLLFYWLYCLWGGLFNSVFTITENNVRSRSL